MSILDVIFNQWVISDQEAAKEYRKTIVRCSL